MARLDEMGLCDSVMVAQRAMTYHITFFEEMGKPEAADTIERFIPPCRLVGSNTGHAARKQFAEDSTELVTIAGRIKYYTRWLQRLESRAETIRQQPHASSAARAEAARLMALIFAEKQAFEIAFG